MNPRMNHHMPEYLIPVDEHMPMPRHTRKKKKKTDYSCLFVRGFNSKQVNLKGLCNVFSNYGNVCMAYIDFIKNIALIKFTTPRGAQNALEVLDGFDFFEGRLNVLKAFDLIFVNFV